MHNLNVIVTPTAKEDLKNIFDYIAADNNNKAFDMIDIFETKFKTLSMFPNSGYRKSYFTARNVRECIVAKHYQIIYTVDNKVLYILRVLTGYQDVFSI